MKQQPDKHHLFRITKVNSSRKRCFRHFGLKKSKTKAPKTKEQVMEDFRHNTTLLGIQHILRRRSIIWTLAYMCCVGMSIFQSWSVTLDFIEQKTHQKFSVQNAKVLPFPSVTVCNAIVLPAGFNTDIIPGYDSSIPDTLNDTTCLDDDAIDDWESKVDENTRSIIRYRRGLSEEQRINLSGGVDTFIEKCRFDGFKCKDFNDTSQFRIFNNPFYGTCITFNPGVDEDSTQTTDVYARLVMELDLREGSMQLDTRRPRAGIQIHAPGTAPILDSASVQDIYGQQSLAFTLRMTIREFIPRRTDSTCVDSMDLTYRKRSRYYTTHTPHRYSAAACMRSCEQKYMAKSCNITEATGPVPEDEAQRLAEAAAYGVYLATDVCQIEEDLDMKFCDCPLPCNLTQYAVAIDTAEMQSPCVRNSGQRGKGNIQTAELAVYFVSNIFEKVEEELTHSLSQFLGILGGNMSLWIGMCVISVLELFELSFNLFRAWLQTRNSVQQDNSRDIAMTRASEDESGSPKPPFVCNLEELPRTTSFSNRPETSNTSPKKVYYVER